MGMQILSTRDEFVNGPEQPFSHKRKGILKIELSLKVTRHSMGVAFSYSSAPGPNVFMHSCSFLFIFRNFVSLTLIAQNYFH